MPVSSDIYNQSQFRAQPMATLADLADWTNQRKEQEALTAERQSLTTQRNLTLQKQQREAEQQAQEDQAIQAAFQKYTGPDGPDRKAIVNDLYRVSPTAAQRVEDAFSKSLKAASDSHKAELEAQNAQSQQLAEMLQGATPDNYRRVFSVVAAKDPDYAQTFDLNPGAPFDPAKVQAALNAHTSRSDYNAAQLKILGEKKDAVETALEIAAITPDAAHYQRDVWEFAKAHQITDDLRQRGLTEQFDPSVSQRAADLVRGVKGRDTLANTQADNARAAAMQSETLRHNRVMEGQGAQRIAQSGANAAGGGLGVAITANLDPNAPTGEDYLKTLNPSDQQMVKALAEGRQPWPTGMALRTPYWQGLVNKVYQYDHTFDTAQASNNARQKVRNDFTSGASAKQINALNTVIGHLGTMSDAAAALGNTASPHYNALKNWIKSATGSADVVNFNTAREAVASELVRVWRQAGGSEQDIQGWKDQINAANSPAQLQAAQAQIGHLLESKLQSLQDQYQQGMGVTKVNVIAPEARAALDKLEGRKGGGAPAASKPPQNPKVGDTWQSPTGPTKWNGRTWGPA